MIRLKKKKKILSSIFGISLCLIPLICNNVASLPSKFQNFLIDHENTFAKVQRKVLSFENVLGKFL